MSRSLLRTAVNRVRALAAAALLILAPAPAWAQSPEMQDILNQISGEFRRTQGERLSENCDYTAIDIAKQAMQRAGFTNMAAGPVVIGALESACKGALSLVGLGLAADAYSLAKCVYDYYTTGIDARALVTCLKVEAGGFAAGKLVDWLDVDAATGALTGRVIDRIGDDLKAGGLDEATAALKEGEIRAFAERMKEALVQVQAEAQRKAQSESPEPIVYTGFAYGCTVTIISRFNKGQPPTRGGNSVAVQISIRDCECYGRAPTVGKAMKEASIFVTVPVDFTPGPGRSPAWTANLARMRTTIRSVCCDGTRTGVDPPGGDTGGGTATGGGTGVVPGTPTQPVEPPPPPPPPKPPPTLAERCPECAPIIADIAQDQADIESAQGRIDRADEELRQLRSERAEQNDEIARAQRLIEITKRQVRGQTSGSSGGMTRTVEISADGRRVTTITQDGQVVSRREEPTGNRDIDAAHDRIVAAREKLKGIEQREAAARQRREAAVAEKARAEAKLRADQVRLEKCEEECRKRISTPPPAPPVLTVPGGGPVQPPPPQPPKPPKPPPPTDLPFEPSNPPPAISISVPQPLCPACEQAWIRADGAAGDLREAQSNVTFLQQLLDAADAADAGRPNPHGYDMSKYLAKSPEEKRAARRAVTDLLSEWTAYLLAAKEAFDEALAKLAECNAKCGGGVTIGGVIGVTGTNPFDPDNPTGTPTGPQQPPPPPPPPPGAPGTLQFSSATYATAEGLGVVVITVTRSGGATGAASVQYNTGQNSATAGADYQSASGTLAWADGEMGGKSISIAVIDDTSVEGTESFSVTLSAPTGAVTVGSPSTATVSIADNDSPPVQTGSLQFSASSYATAEGQGAVTITVTRTGGSDGAVTVQYNTGQNSAIAGADYQSASGTLSWGAGDSSPRSFSVAIVDDTAVESTESFSVTLSNPGGSATLGSPSTATVNIADNDLSTGACGPAGNAWQVNSGTYACSGNCDPCPTPQRLSVDGNRVTISPFHAGGAATFTGCTSPLTSDSNTLTYFGQANHRATLNRNGNTSYGASIQSSGGGSCTMSCIRTGP